MNFELTQEQKLLQENIFETAKRIDQNSPFKQRWKQLAQTGIQGICIDPEHGGSGLGALDLLLALEALGRGNKDNGLSFAIAAHTLACVIPIHKFGTSIQKKKFFPALINGELIASNAMTESESGSDVFSMQCKAERKGTGYAIQGTKTFVSNSTISDLVLTYAVTNNSKGFFGGITSFIVEKDNYSTGPSFKKMGLESCPLGEIHFDGTVLSEDNILGKEGGGAVIFNYSMEWERICLAGIHLGAMQRVLENTIHFVNNRKSQGQTIGKFQGISHSIAEMQVLLEVSKSYAYRVAGLLDQNKNVSKEAAIVKLFVSESLKKLMLQALQIFGGYGYLSEYGIEQEVRDALAATIYSGTSEVQKNIIASNLGI